MTVDRFCDHTVISPSEEIHQNYTDLLNSAGASLYGRVTYQLMQFWLTLLANPSGERSMDDFAVAIDRVPKIVFSNIWKNADPTVIGWNTAKLATGSLEEEVAALSQ